MSAGVALLLAPGPSLRTFNRRRLAELVGHADIDCTMAINSAMQFRDVPIDVISFHDKPGFWLGMAQTRFPEPDKRPAVWTRAMYAQAWREGGFQVAPHADDEGGFQAEMGFDFDPNVPFVLLTITQALGRLVGAGHRLIVMAGVDMTGSSYSFGEDRLQRDGKTWRERWDGERKILRRLMDRLTEEKGALFVRA